MDYQLVIKFWRKSLEDETLLPAIQSELKGVLGDAAELDGYDVSAKEINLFVVTPDPKHSFRRIEAPSGEPRHHARCFSGVSAGRRRSFHVDLAPSCDSNFKLP